MKNAAPQFVADKPLQRLEGLEGFERKDLSPIGQKIYDDLVEKIGQLGNRMNQDLNDRLFVKSLVMGNENLARGIRNRVSMAFARLQKSVGIQALKKLVKLDEAYRLAESKQKTQQERIKLREDYEGKTGRLLAGTGHQLDALNETVRDALASAGNENEFIDTPEELHAFEANMLGVLEKLEVKDDLIDQSMAGVKLDHPYMEALAGDTLEMINRKMSGETLKSADYQKIITWITPYAKSALKGFLNAGDGKQAETAMQNTLKTVENSGTLTMLHVMTPKERFSLGKEILRSNLDNEQKSNLIRFLGTGNFLDVAQMNTLLNSLPAQYRLTETDIKKMKVAQKQIEKLKEMAEKRLGLRVSRNPLLKGGSLADHPLSYLTIGGAAIVTLLPLLFNISHPGQWPDILLDPMALLSLAGAGIAANNISGGKLAQKIQEGLESPDPQKNARNIEQRNEEEFDHFAGGHPQLMDMLLKTDLLSQIHDRAKNLKHPQQYRFTLEAFIQQHAAQLQKKNPQMSEEAANKEAKKWAEKNYGLSQTTQWDGGKINEVEASLSEAYQLLYGTLKLNHPKEMKQAIQKSIQKRIT